MSYDRLICVAKNDDDEQVRRSKNVIVEVKWVENKQLLGIKEVFAPSRFSSIAPIPNLVLTQIRV